MPVQVFGRIGQLRDNLKQVGINSLGKVGGNALGGTHFTGREIGDERSLHTVSSGFLAFILLA